MISLQTAFGRPLNNNSQANCQKSSSLVCLPPFSQLTSVRNPSSILYQLLPLIRIPQEIRRPLPQWSVRALQTELWAVPHCQSHLVAIMLHSNWSSCMTSLVPNVGREDETAILKIQHFRRSQAYLKFMRKWPLLFYFNSQFKQLTGNIRTDLAASVTIQVHSRSRWAANNNNALLPGRFVKADPSAHLSMSSPVAGS